nr:hypothetical protein 8 [Desulfobulbaceae bacterium]
MGTKAGVKRVTGLKNQNACILQYRRIMNWLLADEISEGKARTLGYLVRGAARSIAMQDFEKELLAIKSEIKELKDNGLQDGPVVPFGEIDYDAESGEGEEDE